MKMSRALGSHAHRDWAGNRRLVALFALPSVAFALTACTDSVPEPVPTPAVVPVAQPLAPRSFTVLGSGDVLIHESIWEQAQRDGGGQPNFDKIYAGIKPMTLAADLAICHMETPLANPEGPFTGYPIFNAPPQVARTLFDIGYDSCDTASNHTIDQGLEGVRRTLDALDAAGLAHVGSARSAQERATPLLIRAGDATVGQLAYTFSFNGLSLPSDKPWLSNPISNAAIATILEDAHRTKLAGADVVVVSVHWGTEYQITPDASQLRWAEQLTASPDIDLILGDHVHVPQPVEKFGDKWVVYGMGNQIANQNEPYKREGLMPRFTFTEVEPGVFKVTKAEIIPTEMWHGGVDKRLYSIPDALADPTTPAAVRAACLEGLARVQEVVGRRGAYDDGLILVGSEYL